MATIAMPRKRLTTIRRPLFILGIALALIAFVAVFALGFVFLNRGTGQQSSVVVAAQDIQSRTSITASMLSLQQFPTNTIPPKPFLTAADLKGYSAIVNIPKGQVITANIVAAQPDQINATTAYLPIPQGYVAMALPTGEQQGVAGYVSEGDYINVIATVNSNLFSPSNPRMVTRTVFTNLYVIRVGPPSAAPKEGQPQGLASSVTVVLSQCDAQYMDWLIINTSLKYALPSYHDYKPDSLAKPNPACPTTDAPATIGPAQVDSRWSFTNG